LWEKVHTLLCVYVYKNKKITRTTHGGRNGGTTEDDGALSADFFTSFDCSLLQSKTLYFKKGE